jgi:hypothetical protein
MVNTTPATPRVVAQQAYQEWINCGTLNVSKETLECMIEMFAAVAHATRGISNYKLVSVDANIIQYRLCDIYKARVGTNYILSKDQLWTL